jgi:hypothetical protein
MRNGFLTAALCATLLAFAAPASAATPVVGIGDQKADMFEDPRLAWLGIRHARFVLPWRLTEADRAYADRWLRTARAAGVQPLVAFGHEFYGPGRHHLVTEKEFRREFKRFRTQWPWVKAFVPWNEANHCSQPTCKKPRHAAKYFNVVKGVCRTCTVLAPAVVDQPNMVKWLKGFQRAAKYKASILGLHNYLDTNRLRTTGIKRLMKAFPKKKIWLVETGGLVFRKPYRGQIPMPSGTAHAGKATSFVLKAAHKYRKRVQRVYLYHWNVDRPQPTWDSGLIDWAGVARPSFTVLARFLKRDPLRAPMPRVLPPLVAPPGPPAGSDQPPPSGSPPPSQPPSQPPPSGGGGSGGGGSPPPEEPPPPPPEDPEEPGCSLVVLCPFPLG